ncbi:unnamed protein product, partial [Sphacelaria rigidula]
RILRDIASLADTERILGVYVPSLERGPMEDVHGEGGKLDDELGYDHVDDAMDEQQPQSLLEAIERGDARSVSRVLSELPREEQKRELTEECAAASRAGTSG